MGDAPALSALLAAARAGDVAALERALGAACGAGSGKSASTTAEDVGGARDLDGRTLLHAVAWAAGSCPHPEAMVGALRCVCAL